MSKKDPYQRSIEAKLAERGLAVRRATLDDMPDLFALQRACFPEHRAEQLTSDLTLYRLIEFGDSVVIEDTSGRIVGYHLLILSADSERTAASGALAIHHQARGLGLGVSIYRHSLARAMAAGARIFRGTVAPTNYSSLAMVLNKGGGVCDRFHFAMGAFPIHRFRFGCRLSAHRFERPPIDLGRLAEYARRGSEGVDYQLIAADDFRGIEAIYAETEMRVVAVVPPELLREETVLFALPTSTLETVLDQLAREGPR